MTKRGICISVPVLRTKFEEVQEKNTCILVQNYTS